MFADTDTADVFNQLRLQVGFDWLAATNAAATVPVFTWSLT